MITCGDCAFARAIPADLNQIECGGVPPTPVCFGFQQVSVQLTKASRAAAPGQPIIKCVPPVLPRTYPACALFVQKVVPNAADPLHLD